MRGPYLSTEKTMEHESDGDTNRNWHAQYTHQMIFTGNRGLVEKEMS